MSQRRALKQSIPFIVAALMLAAGCSSSGSTSDTAASATSVADSAVSDSAGSEETGSEETEPEVSDDSSSGEAATFQFEVWADNWSSLYINGELVGEDSVSITTERSFNSETFTFEASVPFTVAVEAKDFKETDSGLEYIGEQNQQMGDGGIIAQITNLDTGEIIAGTDSDWVSLVVHQAPLNTECEHDANPDETCEFLILETPSDWTAVDFDDSSWTPATIWSEADVSPKDGYDDINWDASAQLIWGTDLEVDNTVLLRTTVS